MHLLDFNDRVALTPGEAQWDSLWDGLVHATLPCLGRDSGTRCYEYAFGDHGTLTNFTLASAYRATEGVNAIVFDGSDDRISHANVAERIAGNPVITISAWLWRASAGNGMTFGWENSDPHRAVMIVGNGILYCAVSAGNSTYNAGSIPGNGAGWHHAAIVYDGSASTNAAAGRCYWDGVDIGASGSSTTGTVPTLANLGTLTQGNSAVRGASNGRYAECLIHNRVLTPQEIRQLAYGPGQLVAPRRRRLAWYDAPVPVTGTYTGTLAVPALVAAAQPLSRAVITPTPRTLVDATGQFPLSAAATLALPQTVADIDAAPIARATVDEFVDLDETIGSGGSVPGGPGPFHPGFSSGFGVGQIGGTVHQSLATPSVAATAQTRVSGAANPAPDADGTGAAVNPLTGAVSAEPAAALTTDAQNPISGQVSHTLAPPAAVINATGGSARVSHTLAAPAVVASGAPRLPAAAAIAVRVDETITASTSVRGSVQEALPAPQALAFSGTARARVAVTLGAPSVASAARTKLRATQTVGPSTGETCAATNPISGACSVTVGASVGVTAVDAIGGQAAHDLPPPEVSAAGTQPEPPQVGTLHLTLGAPTVSAAGTTRVTGTASRTVRTQASVTADLAVTGEAAHTLPPPTTVVASNKPASGQVTHTLNAPTVVITGQTAMAASAAATLPVAVTIETSLPVQADLALESPRAKHLHTTPQPAATGSSFMVRFCGP